MKKMLILALMLSLAVSANAALTIVVNGQDAGSEITIAPSDTVMLGVNSDQSGNAGLYLAFMGIVGETTLGEWTGVYDIAASPITIGANAYATPYGYFPDVDMDIWELSNTEPVLHPELIPGVGFNLAFHCLAEGDVDIQLLDEGFSVVDALTIHQVIPEPMTVALLGLGGLFLRRRK